MKPNLDKLLKDIHKFEKKAEFEKTTKKQLIEWIKDEIKNYEKSKSKKIKENKLMDIIILVLQIARRDKISLDKAWKDWFKKSGGYLK